VLQDPTRLNFDSEQVREKEGDVLDEENLRQALNIPDHASIKTASDGKAVLIPQAWNDLHFATSIELVSLEEDDYTLCCLAGRLDW
jgi:hypothetical protein